MQRTATTIDDGPGWARRRAEPRPHTGLKQATVIPMRAGGVCASLLAALLAALYAAFPAQFNDAPSSLPRAFAGLVGRLSPVHSFPGETALMRNSAIGNLDIVRSLLNEGADPNRRDGVPARSPPAYSNPSPACPLPSFLARGERVRSSLLLVLADVCVEP